MFCFHGVHRHGTYTETIYFKTTVVIRVIGFSVWIWKVPSGKMAMYNFKMLCLIVCGLLEYSARQFNLI